ncbi:hypothetical protein Egran_03768 [Elaphomyces granulatus]|uniref:UBR-type domain-containing protein n=1 Tax=Elaphomyces granulatus TaxID=519963 RepID=A0A232LWB2_9EURO|nr:hypothetical protein Egran_03768 [Elaphomyces granulatus]
MDPPAFPENSGRVCQKDDNADGPRRESVTSQTASEFIDSQLKLEADAREILPYSFDACTQPLGSLRQTLFSCLTCNPPPTNPNGDYTPAAVCYSCSISCHGEHTLVELFRKRNFVCDCGTTRLPSTAPCTLRTDPETGTKGIHSQASTSANVYNHNFRNRFCGCGEEYDVLKEKGTMFQCLGLGSIGTGGCGEDWWHPECLVGLPRGLAKAKKEAPEENDDSAPKEDDEDEIPLPPGFPAEDGFDAFICYKCLDSNPWLKRYASTPGFLPPIHKDGGLTGPNGSAAPDVADGTDWEQTNGSKKRRLDDNVEGERESKRMKEDDASTSNGINTTDATSKPKHASIPSEGPRGSFSLFLKENFREYLCHCPDCYPNLVPHPQLREEEESYEPPLSEAGDGANAGGSQGTGSLLERGEAALSNMDRVRAIEGVMVYNHLRDKVKEFLRPFAESGQAVGAEDIKAYFEKLRGDDQAIKEAGGQASSFTKDGSESGGGSGGEGRNNRREQSGMLFQ